jgi:hypothetical protein
MEHIDHYVTKVTTNFKPVPFTFQPSAILQLRLPVGPYIRQRSRKVEIAPGTTLKGIYFMHMASQLLNGEFLCQPTGLVYVADLDTIFGMLSMGSICEDLTAMENGLQQILEDEIRSRIIR